MNELQLSRRTILAVGCLLLSCTIDLPRPTEADQENFATKQFVSEQGGVEVQIPAAWYVKEVPGDDGVNGAIERHRHEQDCVIDELVAVPLNGAEAGAHR